MTRGGDSTLAGVVSMCAGVFCFAVSDALAKGLGEHFSTVEIIFFRMLVSLPLITGIGIIADGPGILKTRHLRAHLMRGVLSAGGMYAFVCALILLPLAQATALFFAAPLFVTMLSVPLLGERVGWQRWLAVAVGFVGVLAIVRPGAGGFRLSTVLPLASALFYALLLMSARRMRTESIWTTMWYVSLVPMLVSAVLLPWFWRTPGLESLPEFVAVGVVATAAGTLITQGFRLGPAAVVAPFDYSGLVWATLFGWLFWREMLDRWAVIGILAIMASGAFIAYRQARDNRRRHATSAMEVPRSN